MIWESCCWAVLWRRLLLLLGSHSYASGSATRSPESLVVSASTLRSSELFVGPVGDGAFELVQVIVEEVSGARDYHQSHRHILVKISHHLFQLLYLTKLIVFTVKQTERLA